MQKEVITLFEEISPQELNKCLQSFICRQENVTAVCSLHAKFIALATVNELKIIIFVLNYIIVLVYTKTLHRSGGG